MTAKLLFISLAAVIAAVTWWLGKSPADPRGYDGRRLRHNWIGRETRDLGRMLDRYAKEPRQPRPEMRPSIVPDGFHRWPEDEAA